MKGPDVEHTTTIEIQPGAPAETPLIGPLWARTCLLLGGTLATFSGAALLALGLAQR